jgi:hypothetical protein
MPLRYGQYFNGMMAIMYWYFNIIMIFCRRGCIEHLARAPGCVHVQLRTTRRTSTNYITTSHTLQCIDDRYTGYYDDTMLRSLYYFKCAFSRTHSAQKIGQILARFFTLSTVTLSLRYVATALDARTRNCGCHVAYAYRMLYIGAMSDREAMHDCAAAGGTLSHMGLHVPTDVM